MEYKCISIDFSRGYGDNPISKSCIIFTDNKSIEKIITFPVDYTNEQCLDCIIDSYGKNNLFIFDKNGLGIAIEDYLLEKDIQNYKTIDFKRLPLVYAIAKERIMEIAINSNFDSFSKIEFKKIVDELDNIEIISNPQHVLKLQRKTIDNLTGRAYCYLNYFSII